MSTAKQITPAEAPHTDAMTLVSQAVSSGAAEDEWVEHEPDAAVNE